MMRVFKITALATQALALLLSLLLAPSQPAQAADDFTEDEHYTRLLLPVRTADPKRIEVTEYFTYACGHCFQFEPLVNRWKSSLPADVAFNRTPAIWGKDHQFLAQVYYTLSAMGVLESMHLPLFQALHQERRQILTPSAMAGFLAEHGISPEDFGQRFASFEVKHAVQKADARGRAYRASGTPALVVNGKYLVETSMAGSPAAMLEVASFLVAQERALLEGDPAAE